MKKLAYISAFLILLLVACVPSGDREHKVQWQPNAPNGETLRVVAIDTMDLANPFVVYDNASDTYYMAGDGGCLWRSNDMRIWEGPYNVLLPSKGAWMGESPVITAPQIHRYAGRYCYVATFTSMVDGVECTSCELFVSDSINGPYKHATKGLPLIAGERVAKTPTFCAEDYGAAYLLFSGDSKRTLGEAIKIIRLGDSLNVQIGEPFELLKAAHNPWAAGREGEPLALGSPFVFATQTGRLGMLFTAKTGGNNVLGVAYSKEGHGINGPWTIEPAPLLCGVGGAMLFKDYDGTIVLAVHKDTTLCGKEKHLPQFIKADLQYEKLKLKGHYKF